MPHLTLEYSANLDDAGDITVDMNALCLALAQAMHAQRDEQGRPIYPAGGIRVRALRCEAYSVAVGLDPGAAFVHANLKIGRGRSEAQRRATGDLLLGVLKQRFEPEFQRRGMALSVEVNEFNELGTWKQNNLHQRLKAAGK